MCFCTGWFPVTSLTEFPRLLPDLTRKSEMKMEEAVGKVEELIESEVPPKTSEKETAKEEDGSVELESQVPKDGVVDSTVLSSMPCLLASAWLAVPPWLCGWASV